MQSMYREYLMVVCAALFLSLSFFIPLLDEMGGFVETFWVSSNPEKTLGAREDLMGSIWIVGKMQELVSGQTETILSDMFVPYGYDFGKATGFGWVDAILALPWVWLIGYPGFYNWHVFWTLFLNVLVLVLFLRRVSGSAVLSIGLAQIAIWNPFVFQELNAGRITQVHWYLLIGMVWCVWELMQDSAKMWHAIGAGVLMWASCLVYWFSAIPVAFLLVLLYAGFLWQTKNRQALLYGLAAASIAVLGIVSIAHRVILPMLQGDTSLYMSMDVQPMSTLLGLPLQRVQPMTLKVLTSAQIPWLIGILGILALVFQPSHRWKMWILWMVAMTIPTGVAIAVGEWNVPTGYSLLHWAFPPLIRCQWPSRMMVAPLLLTLIMVAVVWNSSPLLSGLQSRVKIVFSFILFLFNLSNVPSKERLTVGDFYENTSLTQWAKAHRGGLIEIPYIASYDTYVQQIFHKRPILGGPGLHNVRPKAHQRFVARNALLTGLEQLASGESPTQSFSRRDILQLQKEGLRWVVVYPDMSRSTIEAYRAYLSCPSSLSTDDMWLFDLHEM